MLTGNKEVMYFLMEGEIVTLHPVISGYYSDIKVKWYVEKFDNLYSTVVPKGKTPSETFNVLKRKKLIEKISKRKHWMEVRNDICKALNQNSFDNTRLQSYMPLLNSVGIIKRDGKFEIDDDLYDNCPKDLKRLRSLSLFIPTKFAYKKVFMKMDLTTSYFNSIGLKRQHEYGNMYASSAIDRAKDNRFNKELCEENNSKTGIDTQKQEVLCSSSLGNHNLKVERPINSELYGACNVASSPDNTGKNCRTLASPLRNSELRSFSIELNTTNYEQCTTTKSLQLDTGPYLLSSTIQYFDVVPLPPDVKDIKLYFSHRDENSNNGICSKQGVVFVDYKYRGGIEGCESNFANEALDGVLSVVDKNDVKDYITSETWRGSKVDIDIINPLNEKSVVDFYNKVGKNIKTPSYNPPFVIKCLEVDDTYKADNVFSNSGNDSIKTNQTGCYMSLNANFGADSIPLFVKTKIVPAQYIPLPMNKVGLLYGREHSVISFVPSVKCNNTPIKNSETLITKPLGTEVSVLLPLYFTKSISDMVVGKSIHVSVSLKRLSEAKNTDYHQNAENEISPPVKILLEWFRIYNKHMTEWVSSNDKMAEDKKEYDSTTNSVGKNYVENFESLSNNSLDEFVTSKGIQLKEESFYILGKSGLTVEKEYIPVYSDLNCFIAVKATIIDNKKSFLGEGLQNRNQFSVLGTSTIVSKSTIGKMKDLVQEDDIPNSTWTSLTSPPSVRAGSAGMKSTPLSMRVTSNFSDVIDSDEEEEAIELSGTRPRSVDRRRILVMKDGGTVESSDVSSSNFSTARSDIVESSVFIVPSDMAFSNNTDIMNNSKIVSVYDALHQPCPTPRRFDIYKNISECISQPLPEQLFHVLDEIKQLRKFWNKGDTITKKIYSIASSEDFMNSLKSLHSNLIDLVTSGYEKSISSRLETSRAISTRNFSSPLSKTMSLYNFNSGGQEGWSSNKPEFCIIPLLPSAGSSLTIVANIDKSGENDNDPIVYVSFLNEENEKGSSWIPLFSVNMKRILIGTFSQTGSSSLGGDKDRKIKKSAERGSSNRGSSRKKGRNSKSKKPFVHNKGLFKHYDNEELSESLFGYEYIYQKFKKENKNSKTQTQKDKYWGLKNLSFDLAEKWFVGIPDVQPSVDINLNISENIDEAQDKINEGDEDNGINVDKSADSTPGRKSNSKLSKLPDVEKNISFEQYLESALLKLISKGSLPIQLPTPTPYRPFVYICEIPFVPLFLTGKIIKIEIREQMDDLKESIGDNEHNNVIIPSSDGTSGISGPEQIKSREEEEEELLYTAISPVIEPLNMERRMTRYILPSGIKKKKYDVDVFVFKNIDSKRAGKRKDLEEIEKNNEKNATINKKAFRHMRLCVRIKNVKGVVTSKYVFKHNQRVKYSFPCDLVDIDYGVPQNIGGDHGFDVGMSFRKDKLREINSKLKKPINLDMILIRCSRKCYESLSDISVTLGYYFGAKKEQLPH